MTTKTKADTKADDDQDEPKTSAAKARVGEHVTALVHPRHNGGHAKAAAVVTRVHDDGRVNLHVLTDSPHTVHLTGVELHDSEDAARAALAEHYKALPGHRTGEAGQHIPGRNPRTGDDWVHEDALDWVSLAYRDGS